MERRRPQVVGFEMPIARLDAQVQDGQGERLYDAAATVEALETADPTFADPMRRHNAHRG